MEERCGQRFKRGPINPSGGKERGLKLAYSLQRVIFDRKASSSYGFDTLPTVAYSSRSRVNIIRQNLRRFVRSPMYPSLMYSKMSKNPKIIQVGKFFGIGSGYRRYFVNFVRFLPENSNNIFETKLEYDRQFKVFRNN